MERPFVQLFRRRVARVPVDHGLEPIGQQLRRGNDAVAARARGSAPDESWDFVCECGQCVDEVRLALQQFDARRLVDLPVLAPGHMPHEWRDKTGEPIRRRAPVALLPESV
jgi:hypothetical protein